MDVELTYPDLNKNWETVRTQEDSSFHEALDAEKQNIATMFQYSRHNAFIEGLESAASHRLENCTRCLTDFLLLWILLSSPRCPE